MRLVCYKFKYKSNSPFFTLSCLSRGIPNMLVTYESLFVIKWLPIVPVSVVQAGKQVIFSPIPQRVLTVHLINKYRSRVT